jgi:hypothetical protein
MQNIHLSKRTKMTSEDSASQRPATYSSHPPASSNTGANCNHRQNKQTTSQTNPKNITPSQISAITVTTFTNPSTL